MSLWGNLPGFIPHGHSFFWQKDLLLLHAVADGFTTLAYYSIALCLLQLKRKRADGALSDLLTLFSLLIFACGTAHLLGFWNLWHANYYLEGFAKLATAMVSMTTAILIWSRLPKLISMPMPLELQEATRQRQQEITRRKCAEEALLKAGRALEERVQERTLELEEAKAKLEKEIRDRKKMEELFRRAIEANPVGMVLVDHQGKISLVNGTAARQLGYEQDELMNESIEVLLPHELKERHKQERSDYLKTPGARGMGEGRDLFARRKNGSLMPVEIGLTPVETPSGDGVIATVLDISYRKVFESQLQLKNMALEQSNLELQQFSFIASHDLSEPLRKIQFFSQLILENPENQMSGESLQFMAYINDAGNRMKSLLQSLLTYSQVTSKGKPLQAIDLNTQIQHVISDLQLRIEEKSAQIAVDPLPSVMGDPPQIRQLFQNLVGNSLKYAKKDVPPIIHIRNISTNKNKLILHVVDNGIGFNPKYKEQIFAVFKRLHGRMEYSGTGMGLAIVRKIIQRHNGHIQAEGEEGKGATFIIEFPLNKEDK